MLAGPPHSSLLWRVDGEAYVIATSHVIDKSYLGGHILMNLHASRKFVGLCLGVSAILVASTVSAQSVVVYDVPTPTVTYYAPSVSTPVTTYYAPSVSTPVTTYYAPEASTPVTTYYAPSAAPTTTYYAPTTTYYAPTTAYYAPTTTYYAPTTTYYAPTTAYYAPTTTYYAPTPVTSYYAPGVVVSPKVYVAGQPVRNFFRAVTP